MRAKILQRGNENWNGTLYEDKWSVEYFERGVLDYASKKINELCYVK